MYNPTLFRDIGPPIIETQLQACLRKYDRAYCSRFIIFSQAVYRTTLSFVAAFCDLKKIICIRIGTWQYTHKCYSAKGEGWMTCTGLGGTLQPGLKSCRIRCRFIYLVALNFIS